jgi:hypothetical protein
MSMRSLMTTTTDTGEAIVVKGGAVIINTFSFVEDGSGALASWMKGRRTLIEEDIESNLDLVRNDRSLNRAMQAESHRLKLEAFNETVAARMAKAS